MGIAAPSIAAHLFRFQVTDKSPFLIALPQPPGDSDGVDKMSGDPY